MLDEYKTNVEYFVNQMIEQGCIDEALCFTRLMENGDEDVKRALSVKNRRIFNTDEVKELSKVARSITSNYVPSYISAQNEQEAVLNSSDDRNIIQFPKRG